MRAAAVLVVIILGALTAAPSPASAADARAAWSSESRDELGRLTLVWPQPTTAVLTPADGVARLHATQPVSVPPAAVTAALDAWLLDASAAAGGHDLLLRLRPGTTARLVRLHPRLTVVEFVKIPGPAASTAPPPAAVVQAIEPGAGPGRALPVPRSRPVAPSLPAAAETVAPAPAAVPPPAVEDAGPASPPERQVVVGATPGEGGLVVHFRWAGRVPAAMFARAGQFWAVFPDEGATVAGWRSLDRPEVTRWLQPVVTATAGDARLFRFRLPSPLRIEPQPTADGWTVEFKPVAAAAPETAASPWSRDAERGELTIATVGTLAHIRDPESGERFSLLLSSEAGLRQTAPARLVDLELLPSLQGLVWRALSDGVAATVGEGGVTISRPGGLRLSAPSGQAAASPPPAPAPRRHEAADAAPAHAAGPAPQPSPGEATPMGLGNWPDLDAMGRQQARTRLVGEIPALPEREQAGARLDLARLYLADALGAEARTAVALIGNDAGAASVRNARLALTGAAEALAGRQDQSLANLLDPALDQDGEVALWRAYAAARAARWSLAEQEWRRSGGLPESYPDPLRRRLGLDLAEIMLDRGELEDARALLRQLARLDLRGPDAARLKLLEGIGAGRERAWPAATAALAAAADGGGSDVAIRARFLLLSARAEAGELTAGAAAAALEGERRTWRGHGWEPRMLERLAELQAAAGRPAEAFATRREAIARIADPAAAAERSAELALDLTTFLDDAKVPALVRLAVYRAHVGLLDARPGSERVRAGLGAAAAQTGLLETATALLLAAGQGPTAEAGRAALAAALAGQGELAAASRLVAELPRTGATIDLERELRGRAALAAGDPAGAVQALDGVRASSGRDLQREALARLGDWTGLVQATDAELAAATAGSLGSTQARAAVWQGLAQARLGRPAEASAIRTRYAERIPDAELSGLLGLATVAAPPADGDGRPSGEFAAAVRRHLAALTLPSSREAAVGIRTASERSGPAG